jgi:hypothetical protein
VGIFPEQVVTIPLERAPALVVSDLDAALVPTQWHRLFRERLVGDASDESIVIRRVRPFRRNDFAPQFVGRVDSRGRAIVGHFRQSGFARGFLALWLGVIALLFGPTEVAAVFREGLTVAHRRVVLQLLGMIVVGLVLPRIGWWFGRGDIATIEGVLNRAAARAGP